VTKYRTDRRGTRAMFRLDCGMTYLVGTLLVLRPAPERGKTNPHQPPLEEPLGIADIVARCRNRFFSRRLDLRPPYRLGPYRRHDTLHLTSLHSDPVLLGHSSDVAIRFMRPRVGHAWSHPRACPVRIARTSRWRWPAFGLSPAAISCC